MMFHKVVMLQILAYFLLLCAFYWLIVVLLIYVVVASLVNYDNLYYNDISIIMIFLLSIIR